MDVVNLVLIGSDNVSSSLSSSGYNNICCKFDFQPASWEMLKFIECDVETTENFSDWLGALIVSIEMLKVYEEYGYMIIDIWFAKKIIYTNSFHVFIGLIMLKVRKLFFFLILHILQLII